MALVQAAVEDVLPEAPIHGAMCFVDAELPWLGTLAFGGFAISHPERLARRINKAGPLDPAQVQTVAAKLAARFPPA